MSKQVRCDECGKTTSKTTDHRWILLAEPERLDFCSWPCAAIFAARRSNPASAWSASDLEMAVVMPSIIGEAQGAAA